MLLNEIDFGTIFNAAGARGFYGEGWPFHRWLKFFGLNYNNSGFITKTLTYQPIIGNLHSNWFPDCIRVYPRQECVLNAVGLTNPGFPQFITAQDSHQQLWISKLPKTSIISLSGTTEELIEMSQQIATLQRTILSQHKIALEINCSCPNVQHQEVDLEKVLNHLSKTLPCIWKIGLTTEEHLVWSLQDHPHLSGLTIANSLPWGSSLLDWELIFGTTHSPLSHLGGGALSGGPLFSLIIEALNNYRAYGWDKPIMVGGGLLSTQDISIAWAHGADAFQLGCVSLLKPWRVNKLIKHANQYCVVTDG